MLLVDRLHCTHTMDHPMETKEELEELKEPDTTRARCLFPMGYFASVEWADAEHALTLVASCRDATSLWRTIAFATPDPRCVGGPSDDDFEPVLDALGCSGGSFEDMFTVIVPGMATLAARAPLLFGREDDALLSTTTTEAAEALASSVRLLPSGVSGTVSLSRAQVASLLAMSALGLGLPAEAYVRGDMSDGTYPFPSMLHLIWPKRGCDFVPNVEKVKCFCHYFRSALTNDESNDSNDSDDDKITITRVVDSSLETTASSGSNEEEGLNFWAASRAPLCALKVQPLHTSIDDQEGNGIVRVDFANAQIGGGVFLSTPGSTAQEEITFATHPELCVSKLLCEGMGDGEAILLRGARHITKHTGYLASFQCAGPVEGNVPTDVAARWLAIDALRYEDQGPASQLLNFQKTRRELHKAWTGFRGAVLHREIGAAAETIVATGMWGCGAFNGDPEVKALVQLLAASQAGVSQVLFHAWDDAATADGLMRLSEVLPGVSVGQLWRVMVAVAAELTVTCPRREGAFLKAVVVRLEKERSDREKRETGR